METAMLDDLRTLEQIDGQNWGDSETGPTSMVARCLRLRRTPLRDFTSGDLRLLISQEIGLGILVPRALQLVSKQPLLETDFYPGDLLHTLLRVHKVYWSDNPFELGQLQLIARAVLRAEVPCNNETFNECRAFLTET
jgi:CDI immunity proteins